MAFSLKYISLLLIITIVSCDKEGENPKISSIQKSFVFTKKPTNNCHAATLIETKPNNLLAAWFGGTYEGAKDVGIYTSFFKDDSWSTPKCLIEPLIKEKDTLPCWNPVLFKSKSNNVYLFYKVGKNPREWFGAMIVSKDDGETWSDPEYLPEGILGPIKNKPIEISPGILLCGSSKENIKNNEWRVHIEKYYERNKKWQKIPIENKKNFDIIQPTFLEHSGILLQILCRSKHGKIVSSWSDDSGNTWRRTDTIDIINSNSGIDALTLGKKSFLVVNNPLSPGNDWYNGRNVLDVEHSNDGLKWKNILTLEKKETGQFSYPAIIQTKDEKVHVLYTYNREYIKHVSFKFRD
ncbi:glycosyl hydrolase [Tamlana nanhaiensis]|uniref:Glycosyl hydrolase n=1 Tax=Neotamlana nanhaiensis TaxID=1382798 RepID=A0A0D7VWI5_9FLAO|nr:sialidase family protein [Tamlana nanhaiensis]KJD31169.1 glycosyl hydrolase [Tamlana nanhaiensis]